MALPQQPFFDPIMAEIQRRLGLEVEQGVADLDLRSNRLTEDFNLLLGTPEAPGRFRRQLSRDAARRAGGIAGRGFHGRNSGIMREGMAELGVDQTDALGQLHRGFARQQEDIQREVARLEQSGVIGGAEATRGGAGRSSDRLVSRLPF